MWAEGEILRLLRLRTVSAAVAGAEPGPEASVRKALADEHGQHVMALARDLVGARGMLAGTAPEPDSRSAGDGAAREAVGPAASGTSATSSHRP